MAAVGALITLFINVESNWWFWPLVLFLVSLVIGFISPISGLGGGVIFTSILSAFFPFSIDFIRGTGLVVPLTTALSSAPYFVKKGLANLKIASPLAVVSLVFSVIGSIVGLYISDNFPLGKYYIRVALGLVILFIFIAIAISKQVEFPKVKKVDSISQKLGLGGKWFEPSLNKVVEYRTTNLLKAIPVFAAVGFVAGMFGLGAGWANVPVLNLVMGAPIKVATATSMVIITLNDSTAAWVYLSKGAILPILTVPSVIGITIGARIGARVAVKTKPKSVRYVVMAILLIAAISTILKGLSGLGIIQKF